MSLDVPEPSAPDYVAYSTRRITIEIEDGSWLGNFVWVVFGGLQSAIVWFVAGILCSLTIVGIPCAHQCFKLSGLSLFPFGQSIVYEPAEPCTFFGNVIWLPLGILIAFVHVFWAFLYTCTILGIPFAVQHIKLAQLALWPFGAEITPLVAHARSEIIEPFMA